jgi:hypothetical protein
MLALLFSILATKSNAAAIGAPCHLQPANFTGTSAGDNMSVLLFQAFFFLYQSAISSPGSPVFIDNWPELVQASFQIFMLPDDGSDAFDFFICWAGENCDAFPFRVSFFLILELFFASPAVSFFFVPPSQNGSLVSLTRSDIDFPDMVDVFIDGKWVAWLDNSPWISVEVTRETDVLELRDFAAVAGGAGIICLPNMDIVYNLPDANYTRLFRGMNRGIQISLNSVGWNIDESSFFMTTFFHAPEFHSIVSSVSIRVGALIPDQQLTVQFFDSDRVRFFFFFFFFFF